MMLKRNRTPSHPGVILKNHYLTTRGVSQKAFAEGIEISEKQLSQIINGHKRLEPDVAVRIAKALETTTAFWLELQTSVDVWNAEQNRKTWKPKVVFSAAQYAHESSGPVASAITDSE